MEGKVKDGSIEDLKFDDKNFNKHTEFGMQSLEKSVQKFGFGRSIVVDKNNKIIGGNGMVETANNVGMTKTKVIETDGKELIVVKRTDVDLDSAMGREMALADNATAAADLEWDETELEKAEYEFNLNLKEWGVDLGNDYDADDFDDEVNLPEGDKSNFRRYGFMLNDAQYDIVIQALEKAKSMPNFKEFSEFQENENSNGNALIYIIQQWEEQKK